MFGQRELRRVLVDVRFWSRVDSLRTIDCVLFGSNCDGPRIVPVPVHKGYEEGATAVDLEFQQYINVVSTPYNSVIRFYDHAIEIDRIKLRGRTRICPFKFVVFFGNNATDHTNLLIQAMPGARDAGVWGNVLVTKVDGNGVALNATNRDISLIEAAVKQ
ncbi:hypothetical protein BKA70DRAFT_1222265 [Coprinopsis sp. MPI-PUGE-AT-0042]|nr:hypothetical protein BKA70DRAFT_1428375 [Coprinopsis sp. MPI-PUGE-AT-0042]KAH6908655.1 hypothetical protein BKA70DRAFT_1222265 [Coprinopsis sp. MPI-PUGE-AT-0042]